MGYWRNGRSAIILMQGGLTVGIPSSGSIGNNGALSGIAALDATYSGGIYLYFPANAIFAGSAAGLYYCVMSSTTAGTIYNNTYTGGVPTAPASPTPFASTGPGAYTQTTGEITLSTQTVPGGIMGINGALRVNAKIPVSASVNAKTVNVKLSTTTLLNGTTSTGTVNHFRFQHGLISNLGSASRQMGEPGGAFGGANGVNSGGSTFGAVNTAADQSLTVTGTLGAATEYILLENLLVEVLPS